MKRAWASGLGLDFRPLRAAVVAMSRHVSGSAVDKVLDATDGAHLQGADRRSKAVQGLSHASLQGTKLRFVYNRKLRIGIPAFIAGFATCAWLNFAKRPAPIVVKKVVKKKKPKSGPIIEELPDDDPVPSMSALSPGEEIKLVLVVNESLKMNPGKIAAQCCHATLAVYQSLEGRHQNILRQWEAEGQKKIALKCKSDAEMQSLLRAAEAKRIPCYLVADAGRTQVAAGSKTVLAIGPAPEMVVNEVTGSLRLL